ncbi:bifunctional D-glycero-beta-D-manno-heptose-7-phosphate kinase/D-glycero-beta-D-manno-heptose 1-phosphate adenylyltransferase HldE [uncultured Chloroflexus sp.]|uniref:bifunctional D-glycero-beta-D-manno-heptose-7-phosphate kinase/D-glycero-beta-D-manno-heptose 1-phosphate adenylyltransferase HldE n=1 Tax=uncultured Chloroflexus sp. TaxID=214040 RepID=UPI00260DB766|nr:bifunctional D-glycero-beta-D-manno-heptose-7-phosphate kinase/D-glycero-beta-D-manno-heptose 1-phosphate adenylyltransferase HldE [uncultured Chloroflexus sp.]
MRIKMQLPDLSSIRILVVGDVMLDRYWFGEVSRISPEAPVPVVKFEKVEERLGGAANVARNIVAIGATATLLSVVGADEAGQSLARLLAASGIDASLHEDAQLDTTVKLRVLGHQQQLLRIDFENSPTHEVLEAMLAEFRQRVMECDVVIFSDYGKGGLKHISEMIRLAREHEKPILVDPKGDDWLRYAGASVITPNRAELREVVGHWKDEADLAARVCKLRTALGVEALLLTRSEEGMTLFDADGATHVSAQAREVFDVSGAGDTVIATLAAMLASGASLAESMRWANRAAGIVVAKLGTATVTREELQGTLLCHDTSQRGVVSETVLLQLVKNARSAGERIVMTNGCFDILHPGHVDYLERARSLGDRLVVAVNDDDSVRRLKGSKRPINPLEVRMRMLSALASVDWVVPFSEDTPEQIVCKVLPDILVKGGDYHQDEIAGSGCVLAAGGMVKVLEFLPGHSTSKLIEKIHQRG